MTSSSPKFIFAKKLDAPRRSVASHLAVEQTFGPKTYTRRSEISDLVERKFAVVGRKK